MKGYVIAASSPATESLENVIACAENGAAAVILKSASGTRLGSGETRRCHIDETGFWAESGFDREIMPVEQAASLISQAANAVKVPVIASVTELTLAPGEWLKSCLSAQKAGASAIQLDFFYLPNFLLEAGFADKFITLIKTLKKRLRVPVMPKLNIGLPAEIAVHLLKRAEVQYVSLLDSIRSPAPEGAYLSGESLSVFGSFMFPLTRRYTYVMAKAGFTVCAGGGVTSGKDAAELIRLGASAVQVAADVLLHGFARFNEINSEATAYLSRRGPVEHCERPPLQKRSVKYEPAKCTGCGKCKRQTFCPAAADLALRAAECEGCGFCAGLCGSGAVTV